jgi:protocatechuate 3,4-dioxygenase beta subunit
VGGSVNTGPDEAISDPVARLLDGCAATCHLWPEQEEGPYRRGDQPRRRDVTEGRAGLPLALGLRLRTDNGDPLAAEVEIWHCDALGRYSGYPPPDPSRTVTADTAPRAEYLPDETFLRGRQSADAAGRVEFRTIYPGWYPGRTVHIHVMVHAGGRTYTSQLYFPEGATRAVFARPPYRERPTPDTSNESDEIYPTGGDPALLEVIDDGEGGHLAGLCLTLPEAAAR